MNTVKLIFCLMCIIIQFEAKTQSFDGFFKASFDDSTGKMLLTIDKLDTDFLMVNAYGTGIGSNDIGVDRGKLSDVRVVRFEKQGDKILLVQPNQDYRAVSSNPLEVLAVEEAFAKSVIFGFKIEKKDGQNHIIDIAPMLMEDLNNVVQTLKETKQGTYKIEKSRCALYLENTHAFPKNNEFESILTVIGEPTGKYIKSVTPSPESISFRQHVSFIELPDNGYTPREFHPESGFFYRSYFDYATPIYEPIDKKFIVRHRLEKKNPELALSEAKEPIIYYIDPGCPDPIKSALVEGGNWWAQAFEAAGFKNAFEVREMPKGAHPLDVRYNMIQWIHRSTRGWSYGSSIADPRTGEILKGHVSLGSLRVRQDFMIAQSLAAAYSEDDTNHDPMMTMALARLRQLSAHEIGHTLGLAHNFASSINDMASVMDYPHPKFMLDNTGKIDLTQAYDDKIGIWDKRSIMYGYTEYKNAEEEKDGLKSIIAENHDRGLLFMTDEDARPAGSASPVNHMWDVDSDPVKGLSNILEIRAKAMEKFGINTIPNGTPISELANIFVPLYFMHRYQVEAVSKIVGGVDYTYAMKGEKNAPMQNVSKQRQKEARSALLNIISESTLKIPSHIETWLYPPAYGYKKTRESFESKSAPAFDTYATYESAVDHIFSFLLEPNRLNRLMTQGLLNDHFSEITKWLQNNPNGDIIKNTAEIKYVSRLLMLNNSESINSGIKSYVSNELKSIKKNIKTQKNKDIIHAEYILDLLDLPIDKVKDIKLSPTIDLPPGAPIGSCGHFDY